MAKLFPYLEETLYVGLCLNTLLTAHYAIPHPMPIFAMKDMWYWSIVKIPLKVYGQPAIIHELGSSFTKVIKTCPRPSVAGGQQ